MSIGELKKKCADVPGINKLTMRYEDRGQIQVFAIGERELRLGPTVSTDVISAAIREELG